MRLQVRSALNAQRSAAVVVGLSLALALSGCGSNAPAVQPSPSPSTAPVMPSSSPTPSVTPTPLSAFEWRPQVKVLRKWDVAVARDINARSRQLVRARKFEDPSGYTNLEYTVHEEFDKYYPGPAPFTPVAVTGTGNRSTVTTCLLAGGFALTHKGGRTATKHHVIALNFTMIKVKGVWKLGPDYSAKADCSRVKIVRVLW